MTEVVTTHLLSNKERDTWNDLGFVILPRIFSPAEIDNIDRELIRLINVESHLDQYHEKSSKTGQSLLRRVEQLSQVSQTIRELLYSKQLAGRVSELFGEPALLFKDKLNLKLPGGAGFRAHLDGHFRWLNAEGRERKGWLEHGSWFINAVIAIDASTLENGCLEVAPLSFTQEVIGGDFDMILIRIDGRGPDITHEDEARIKMFPLELNPGDVVLFDWRCVHRSGPNQSSDPRRLLYATYNRLRDGNQMESYYKNKNTSAEPLARKALS